MAADLLADLRAELSKAADTLTEAGELMVTAGELSSRGSDLMPLSAATSARAGAAYQAAANRWTKIGRLLTEFEAGSGNGNGGGGS